MQCLAGGGPGLNLSGVHATTRLWANTGLTRGGGNVWPSTGGAAGAKGAGEGAAGAGAGAGAGAIAGGESRGGSTITRRGKTC